MIRCIFKVVFVVVIVFSFFADSMAQGWSLEQCVGYALEHNIEVRQRLLEVRQGELAVR